MKKFKAINRYTNEVVRARCGLSFLVACGVPEEELKRLDQKQLTRLMQRKPDSYGSRNSPKGVLVGSFPWGATPQGYQYWSSMFDRLARSWEGMEP